MRSTEPFSRPLARSRAPAPPRVRRLTPSRSQPASAARVRPRSSGPTDAGPSAYCDGAWPNRLSAARPPPRGGFAIRRDRDGHHLRLEPARSFQSDHDRALPEGHTARPSHGEAGVRKGPRCPIPLQAETDTATEPGVEQEHPADEKSYIPDVECWCGRKDLNLHDLAATSS